MKTFAEIMLDAGLSTPEDDFGDVLMCYCGHYLSQHQGHSARIWAGGPCPECSCEEFAGVPMPEEDEE